MVRKSYGKMRGSRLKFRGKRKPAITHFLRTFEVGDHVHVDIVPSSSFPHHRFQGKTGEIIEKRGESYGISVRDGTKMKTIFLGPEHLKKSG